MKLAYFFQLKDMLIMIAFGFIFGVIYGLLNIPNKIKKIFPLQIFSDILFTILFSASLFFLINLINHGEIRLFLIFKMIFF